MDASTPGPLGDEHSRPDTEHARRGCPGVGGRPQPLRLEPGGMGQRLTTTGRPVRRIGEKHLGRLS